MPPEGSGPEFEDLGQSQEPRPEPELVIAQGSPKAESQSFKDRSDCWCSKPRSPIIGELRAQGGGIKCISPSVTEVSNDAVEVEFQGLGFHITMRIRLLHKDRGGLVSGGQDLFNHLEKDRMTNSLPRSSLMHGAWNLEWRNMGGVLRWRSV